MNWPTVRIETFALHRHHGRDAGLGEARAERGERAGVRGAAGVAGAGALAGGQHDEAGRALEPGGRPRRARCAVALATPPVVALEA